MVILPGDQLLSADIIKMLPDDFETDTGTNEKLVVVLHHVIDVALAEKAAVEDKVQLFHIEEINIPDQVPYGSNIRDVPGQFSEIHRKPRELAVEKCQVNLRQIITFLVLSVLCLMDQFRV